MSGLVLRIISKNINFISKRMHDLQGRDLLIIRFTEDFQDNIVKKTAIRAYDVMLSAHSCTVD